jgi:hypothetical protein
MADVDDGHRLEHHDGANELAARGKALPFSFLGVVVAQVRVARHLAFTCSR